MRSPTWLPWAWVYFRRWQAGRRCASAGVPAPALWLGLAGVLPFAAAALASWRPEAAGALGATTLLTYGAVILS